MIAVFVSTSSAADSDRAGHHVVEADAGKALCRSFLIRSASQLPTVRKIGLSSNRANPLSKSRNQRADDDGCDEFAPDAGVAHGFQGCEGLTIGDGHS